MMKTLLTAVSLVLVSGTGVAYSQQSVPQNAEPLSAAELKELYSDRTWRWDEGAGYFAPDGEFHAITDDQGEHAYTMGTWSTAGQGQLCFEGEWNSRDDSAEVTTCFSHVQADGMIYQVTDWEVLANLDLDRLHGCMNRPVFVDLWNAYQAGAMVRAGFAFTGVGNGAGSSSSLPEGGPKHVNGNCNGIHLLEGIVPLDTHRRIQAGSPHSNDHHTAIALDGGSSAGRSRRTHTG